MPNAQVCLFGSTGEVCPASSLLFPLFNACQAFCDAAGNGCRAIVPMHRRGRTDAVGTAIRLIFSIQRTAVMNSSLNAKSPVAVSHVADSGKIVLGAGIRLPAAPAHVADQGKIGFGAGIRLPSERKPA